MLLPVRDQRYVRRSDAGFISSTKGYNLCDGCGADNDCYIKKEMNGYQSECGVKSVVNTCGVYIPVISFTDTTGTNRTFNTFRRGGGWFNRLKIGDKIRLFDSGSREFIGNGKVVERHLGALGALLEDHAAMNHLLRDEMEPNSDTRLQRILITLYGRNYTTPDAEFSVIYIEAEDST